MGVSTITFLNWNLKIELKIEILNDILVPPLIFKDKLWKQSLLSPLIFFLEVWHIKAVPFLIPYNKFNFLSIDENIYAKLMHNYYSDIKEFYIRCGDIAVNLFITYN